MKQKRALRLVAISVVLLCCFSVRTVANEPVRIMPLGDSITKGVGTSHYNGYRKPLYLNLTNSGYNVDFVGGETNGDFNDPDHEGHSGWHAKEDGTVYDIYDQVYGWLVATPPEIVLLHIGTNDISESGEDANEVNDILNKIDIYESDSNEAITVILALIINRRKDADPNLRQATTQFNIDVNDMAQSRIAAGDDIIVVDMESVLDYNIPGDMFDKAHPSDAGYEKMAWVWYDALDILLGIAPKITSTPLMDVTIGQLYTYDVDANGCPDPSYVLTEYPNDMTIDPNTGLIEWTPTTIGDFNVTVEASNGHLPDASQSFTIIVSNIIKFDAASSDSNSSDGNTLSWQHTIGSGDDRILVVSIAGKDNDPCDLIVSSVAYNDVNMGLVEGSSRSVYSPSAYMKTELYYLLDSDLPLTGSYMVEVTYSGSVSKRCGGAISLANVEQQPREAVDTNSNTGVNSISTTITTLTDGAWVVDVVGCGHQGSFTATTVDMIERFDTSSNGSAEAGSTKFVTSAGPTTMSWDFNSSANQLVHSVAAFAPASHIIAGCISEPNGAPVEDVNVLVDANVADVTDPNGYYEVLVSYSWSGVVTPIKDGHLFDPYERTYSNVTTDLLGQDYTDISIYDLEPDGLIDLRDLDVICENWLATGPDIPGDIYYDEIINFLDFAEFAQVW